MYFTVPDNQVQVRPFAVFCPLTKAAGAEEARPRTVFGPVASEKEDYDGELAERSGIIKGLEMHSKLGGWVDWDHMYPPTRNAKFLIGNGTPMTAPDGRPWLATDLRKGNEWADQVLDMTREGRHLGYSIWGAGVKDGKVIKSTSIHLVTIAPSPKGFDQWLQLDAPQNSLMAVAKAVMDGGAMAGVAPGWMDLPAYLELAGPMVLDPVMSPMLAKAFTTGSGVVQPAAEGGQALRTQYLAGGLPSATFDADVRQGGRRKKKGEADGDSGDSGDGRGEDEDDDDSPVLKALAGELRQGCGAHNAEAIAVAVLRQIRAGK